MKIYTIENYNDRDGQDDFEYCKPDEVRVELARKDEEIARLRKGINAVDELINQSYGVDRFHLNGDVAPWEELRKGGRFEGWLRDFDEALAEKKKTEPGSLKND